MFDIRDREELLTTQTTDETEDSKPQVSSKEKLIESEIFESRKKPHICIPVFDININYLNMKIKKPKKNSSKNKNNFIYPLNIDQIRNQINAQINKNNNTKSSDNKNEEDDMFETSEGILNESITDDKNSKNIDMSFNNIKVDLGFLSKTNSEIGDDLKNLNENNNNININKLNNNINNQTKTKNQSPFMINQLLLNNLGMMNNVNNINNFNQFGNFGNNLNNNLNYLQMMSKMNNMNLFGNNNNIVNNIQNLNKISNMKINNNNYFKNFMSNNLINIMNNLNLNNNYNDLNNNNNMNKITNLPNFNYMNNMNNMNNNSLNKVINNNKILAFLNNMTAQQNQEEFSITRKFKENTPEGVKIYKIKYSSSLVKNNSENNK
jgi:hypothetical protein